MAARDTRTRQRIGDPNMDSSENELSPGGRCAATRVGRATMIHGRLSALCDLPHRGCVHEAPGAWYYGVESPQRRVLNVTRVTLFLVFNLHRPTPDCDRSRPRLAPYRRPHVLV